MAVPEPRDVDATSVLDALGHAVVVTDLAGVVAQWNHAAEQLYGWSSDEAIGRSIYELTVPAAMHEYAVEIMTALDAGSSWSGVFTVCRKDGSTFSALVTDTGVHDEYGHLVGLVGVSFDIGEPLRPFLQRSHEATVITDAHGVIRLSTPGITGLTGWNGQDLPGKPWWSFVHPEDRPAVVALQQAAATTAELLPAIEHRVQRADGSWLWVDAAATNLLDDPVVRGVVLTLRDISERHASMEELVHRALHDPLTGLLNRAAFMEYLELQLVTRQHQGALLYVDLDDFKAINDSFGHAAGDAVLGAVATRVKECMRPEDVCGRLGGDEFAVLVRSVSDRAHAAALVRRLEGCISQPVAIDAASIRPQASIGFALLTKSADPDQAMRLADEEMYRRKRHRITTQRTS